MADLKNAPDLEKVRALISKADVVIQNFRPGVMERIGLDYETVRQINPRIIYGSATGYGPEGPWKGKPGQDLLAQAMSGLPWLNGSRGDLPIPVGIAIADVLTSCHLAHGVTALLLRRERTGVGGLVDTSLMEAMLDMQFELLSAHLYDQSIFVRRGSTPSAHPFLPAPYGIYPTKNGFLAIAMNSVPRIGELIGKEELTQYEDSETWWSKQDEITRLIADRLATATTQYWLNVLEPADIWCAPLYRLPELVQHEGFKALGMTQEIVREANSDHEPALTLTTTRSPIRIDGQTLTTRVGAPRLGEQTQQIVEELLGRGVDGPPLGWGSTEERRPGVRPHSAEGERT